MTAQRRTAAVAARRLVALGGSLVALGVALTANIDVVRGFANHCLGLLNPLRQSPILPMLQSLVLGATLFLILALLRGALVFAGQWREASRLVRDARPIAFTYGFLRPRVIVSTALVDGLSSAELAAILHHERYHARARDPFWVALSRAVVGSLPFFPPGRTLAGRLLLAKELAADEYAVERCGGPDPLVGALVRLVEAGRPARLILGAAAGGAEEAAARLRRLLAYPTPVPPEPVDPGRKVLAAATALSTLALLVAAEVPLLPRGAACAASALLN